MKTIFISSFHALISRNILGTDILPLLKEKGVRIVLVVPKQKVEYFQKTFGSDQIVVEGISSSKKYFEDFLYMISLSLVGVENHIVRGWKTDKRYIRYYNARMIHRFFSRCFFLHKALRFLARTYLRAGVFKELFSIYKPDLVVTTDSFFREDRDLLVEAKKGGIPTVGMIRSWDNATTKGVFLAEPDRIIVPNEVLKEEMMAIHHIDPKKIYITGIPHYDLILRARNMSRDQFFADIGLDENKKTILFAPGGKILYKHDAEILLLLKRHIDAGHFNHPVQFLVRIPPGDRVDVASIKDDKNFIIDDPGVNVTGRKKESELSQSDNDRLNNSIFYSDVVLTLVSTMAIDGTVFHKPVVVLGFDPKEGLPDAIDKFAKYMHFEKFLGTGLVTVSHSEEEFLKQMNAFLDEPDLNKKEREALVVRYAYKLDGKSSQRVANCILDALEK